MDVAHPEPHDADLRAQMAWVDQLARRLVSDPEAAADVAQDVWVRVLLHPIDDGGNVGRLRAWLARVVRSSAIDAARSRNRRTRRETLVARPDRAPTTLDVVERLSARQKVVAAVLALREPYRTTVLLRYFDELDAAAIGEQMGVPPATVRKRLSRGLAQLRADLGTGPDGGPGLLASLFALLPRRAGRTPAASSPSLSGTAAMAKTASSALLIKLAVGLAVVAGVVLSSLWVTGPDTRSGAARGDAIRPSQPEIEVTPFVQPAAPARQPLVAASRPEPGVAVPELAAPGSPVSAGAGPALLLTVLDEIGKPVPAVAVTERRAPDTVQRTDADGHLRLPVQAGQSLAFVLQHPGYCIERLQWQIPEELGGDDVDTAGLRREVVLTRGASARVVVTSSHGVAIPGALVRLRDMRDNTVDGTVIGTAQELARVDLTTLIRGVDIHQTRTGPDGIALVEGLRPAPYELRVLADAFVEVDRKNVEVLPGFNDLGVVQLADAVLVQGVVTGPRGPLAGARVQLLVSGTYASVETDDQGRFEIHTLPDYPTRNRLVVGHPEHDTLCAADVRLDASPLELRLEPRRVARLQLVDPVLGTLPDGAVTVSREFDDDQLLWAYKQQQLPIRDGELVIEDLASCLQGVLLKLDGYPRTWVSLEQLTQALLSPLPVLLEGQAQVLLVVTDVASGALLPDAGFTMAYERVDDQGRSLNSYSWFSPGGRSLFDAEAGGSPLDAAHLRLGRFADDTQGVSVTASAEGYLPAEPVVLVKDGQLVRRGEVAIRLERADEG